MFDLNELAKRVGEAAEWDLSTADDDEVLAAVVGLAGVVSQAEVAYARWLAEVQARGLTDARHGCKTVPWVAAEARVDRRGVARHLRLGCRMRRLRAVEAAVAAGELSVDHARALADHAANPRVGDQIEATQTAWLELAGSTSFADWRHQLDRAVALLDDDGGYDPNRDLGRNTLRLTPLPDGSIAITGELTGEQALVVRACVEAHADRLFHRLRRDHELCPELPMPQRASLMAMALAELIQRGAAVEADDSTGPTTDVTLVIRARSDLAPPAGDPQGFRLPPPSSPAGPPAESPAGSAEPADPGDDPLDPFDPLGLAEVLDPYPAATRDRRDRWIDLLAACGPAETTDGWHVPRHVAEVLLCDPALHALVVDSLGVALDLGRTTRFANRAQRRALAHRDGGCVFPGCDVPVGWCDAHHVVEWSDGGQTDLANLALLCRYHHGVTHRAGWTMTAQPGETFTWRTPLGQTLHSQRRRGRCPTSGAT